MNKQKSPLNTIKKTAVILFCTITITMNIINYVRGDASKGLGTVYQWSQEAEISDLDYEIREYDISDVNAEINAVSEDFSPVNINTADIDELQSLKGIGPSKAAAVIEYRQKYGSFVVPEEIMEVPGIGEGIYAKIRDLICIE